MQFFSTGPFADGGHSLRLIPLSEFRAAQDQEHHINRGPRGAAGPLLSIADIGTRSELAYGMWDRWNSSELFGAPAGAPLDELFRTAGAQVPEGLFRGLGFRVPEEEEDFNKSGSVGHHRQSYGFLMNKLWSGRGRQMLKYVAGRLSRVGLKSEKKFKALEFFISELSEGLRTKTTGLLQGTMTSGSAAPVEAPRRAATPRRGVRGVRLSISKNDTGGAQRGKGGLHLVKGSGKGGAGESSQPVVRRWGKRKPVVGGGNALPQEKAGGLRRRFLRKGKGWGSRTGATLMEEEKLMEEQRQTEGQADGGGIANKIRGERKSPTSSLHESY